MPYNSENKSSAFCSYIPAIHDLLNLAKKLISIYRRVYFWNLPIWNFILVAAISCTYVLVRGHQGVPKRCRLSWLINSALVYELKCSGGGGGLRGLSQWVQLYTGAQFTFRDLTPYLIYGAHRWSYLLFIEGRWAEDSWRGGWNQS